MGDFEDVERLVVALVVHRRLGSDGHIESEDSAMAFIVQVRSRACTGVNHPTQGPFWSSAQQRLDLMELFLRNPSTRSRLNQSVRIARERERERRLERLSQAVETIHASGATSITVETRELISSAHVRASLGLISDADLALALERRRITCLEEPRDMQDPGLPDSDMIRLENELQVFGTDNIYSFVGLPFGAPLEISRRRTAERKSEWAPRRPGHLKGCAQSIISRAEAYFASESARSRYDFSYVRRRMEEEGLVTNADLAGIDGLIDENEWTHLVKQGIALGYPRNQVERVIEYAAALKHIRIAPRRVDPSSKREGR